MLGQPGLEFNHFLGFLIRKTLMANLYKCGAKYVHDYLSNPKRRNYLGA